MAESGCAEENRRPGARLVIQKLPSKRNSQGMAAGRSGVEDANAVGKNDTKKRRRRVVSAEATGHRCCTAVEVSESVDFGRMQNGNPAKERMRWTRKVTDENGNGTQTVVPE